MKINSLILMLGVCTMTLASCSKCTECDDCPIGFTDETICRDGYDSNNDYQAAIDGKEDIGCECKGTVK